ncbi:MAG: hypothetical protein EOP24_44335 [Hyphomicrobiales bacterium]|nr:MAG: hypothetical protein EOP24_44335 [Hyphomicrobiales bacterium]
MDKPNVRLILRAVRKKTDAKLAIRQNKHLLRERAESLQSDIPSPENVVLGGELNGEIDHHQIPFPGI